MGRAVGQRDLLEPVASRDKGVRTTGKIGTMAAPKFLRAHQIRATRPQILRRDALKLRDMAPRVLEDVVPAAACGVMPLDKGGCNSLIAMNVLPEFVVHPSGEMSAATQPNYGVMVRLAYRSRAGGVESPWQWVQIDVRGRRVEEKSETCDGDVPSCI
ncbi:hypothetical protein D6D21_08118 [Aureobasidium pullulans]|uniref:Uncharacterized protein n=1 Tax=Aureobasidium pullulans TaxID=5580 RepID=A0AB74IPJ8_AURPU|nr:hypothetical protein D6D21_08118 [Aureobasidium pullulans]